MKHDTSHMTNDTSWNLTPVTCHLTPDTLYLKIRLAKYSSHIMKCTLQITCNTHTPHIFHHTQPSHWYHWSFTGFWQGYHRGVTGLLLAYYKGVPGFYRCVIGLLQGCWKCLGCAPRVIQKCHRGVTGVLQGVTERLKVCIRAITCIPWCILVWG